MKNLLFSFKLYMTFFVQRSHLNYNYKIRSISDGYDIIMGTVCDVVSAGIWFIVDPTIGAIPSLFSAIYTACQIEKLENITDQTGLKYLVLVDKTMRK